MPTFDVDGVSTPHTADVTLLAGETRDDVDFGYQGSAGLGNRVWQDDDGDGVQDGGEPGLSGVTVQLLDAGGALVDSTLTGTDGFYSFDNLAAGTYTVRVVASSLPGGLGQTFDLDGAPSIFPGSIPADAPGYEAPRLLSWTPSSNSAPRPPERSSDPSGKCRL